jgi:hypothetical protein
VVPIAVGVVSKWQFHRKRLPLSFFDPPPPFALDQGTWLSAGLTFSKPLPRSLSLPNVPTVGRDKEPADVQLGDANPQLLDPL